MEGPVAYEIIISDTLIERACHEILGPHNQPMGASVKLESLTKYAYVLDTFLHHYILPSAHKAKLRCFECVLLSIIMNKEPFD